MWSRLACMGLAMLLGGGCARAASNPPEEPDPDTLSVGYSAGEPRTRQTGAVETVLAEDKDASRYSTVEQYLEGRVAGLEVTRLPNGGYRLRIRGTTSVNMSSEPLLVIDGVQISPESGGSALAGMSPADIDRIDVLKDAGATAIYGVRGANGVIVITTKRGNR